MIDWFKKCKKDKTAVADRRTWSSRCGVYKIEESDIRYGRKYKRNGDFLGYPIIYRAMVHLRTGWEIISYHRKRSTAYKALEYYDEHGHAKPKPKKKRRRVVRDVSDQLKEKELERA